MKGIARGRKNKQMKKRITLTLLACVIMIYNGPIVYSVHSSNLVRRKKNPSNKALCVWLLFQELFKSEG